MSKNLQTFSGYSRSSDKIEIVFGDGTPATIYVPLEVGNYKVTAETEDYDEEGYITTYYTIKVYDANKNLIKSLVKRNLLNKRK